MITNALTLLVSGVGGDLGQALVKALRLMPEAPQIIGCDVEPEGIGSVFVDDYRVVPLARDNNYLDVLSRICEDFEVQALIPGSEPEIEVLSKQGDPPQLPSGVPIVCQPHDWRETFGDKLTCMAALQGKVELAPFADGSDAAAVNETLEKSGFPVIVKGRRASGSKAIHLAKNRQELNECLKSIDYPLVQAYIDDEGGEYSIAAFKGTDFSRYIAFRRVIQPPLGCSWHAETSENHKVLSYARRVAQATNAKGSLNIQVRHSSRGVRLLEINPRFSSLVAARAVAGFRDAEWAVKTVLEQSVEPPSEYRSIRFQRYAHEVVDTGDGYYALEAWQPKTRPK